MRWQNGRSAYWQPWAFAAAVFTAVLGFGYFLNESRDDRVKQEARQEAARLSLAARQEAVAAESKIGAFFAGGHDRTTSDTPRRMILHEITFAPNEATLQPESMPVLDELAEGMKEQPRLRISIEGHTDDFGRPTQNKELSLARATTVRRALIGRGIAEGRMEVVGWGGAKPLVSNDAADGRDQNNRMEFVTIGLDPGPMAH